MMRPLWNRLLPAMLASAGFMAIGLATVPANAESSLVIRDFVLTHDIHQREPMGTTDFYRVGDGKAVAFARIWNSDQPTRVSFVWHFGDKTHASVPVNVGVSPGWRTWSTVNLRAGTWRVELVDAQGYVLAEKAFTVGPNSAGPMADTANPMQGDRSDSAVRFEGVEPAQVPASATYPER